MINYEYQSTLKVLKCGNPYAAAAIPSTTVDAAANTGLYTSIAIGSDDLPVISYYDDRANALRVVKCANADCTGSATLTTVDDSADVGSYTSIAIGADDLPLISSQELLSNTLKVVRCDSLSRR